MSERYQRGQLVRIIRCPLGGQHDGLRGRLIEADSRPLCVDIDDPDAPGLTGHRCWTGTVALIDQPQTEPS